MQGSPRAKICRWIAATYFVWSVLVYFGSFRGDLHSWWPLFLYFIIWPLGAGFEVLSSAILAAFLPGSGAAAGRIYFLVDALSGFLYIVGGTLWIWLVATILSRAGGRLLRR